MLCVATVILTTPVPPLVGTAPSPLLITSVIISNNSATLVCAAASPLLLFVVCEVTDCKEL